MNTLQPPDPKPSLSPVQLLRKTVEHAVEELYEEGGKQIKHVLDEVEHVAEPVIDVVISEVQQRGCLRRLLRMLGCG